MSWRLFAPGNFDATVCEAFSMPNNDLVMGFDYGTKKIGIAIGQQLTNTATPLAIVKASNGKPDWASIEPLVNEWQPKRFVVGLPINMDDSESEMSIMATRFARQLSGRFSLPVDTMDERLSSFAVRHLSKDNIDDLSAVVILESWLRQQTKYSD